MKKTVRISTDLLPTSLRLRFNVLLNAAQPRSIVQWEAVAPIAADVVVIDGMVEAPAGAVAMVIGDTPSHAPAAQDVRLESSYGITSLRAALDLAAVRVLNRWDNHRKSDPAYADDPESTFKLRHWVALNAEMTGPAHSRVLAAMTRRGVTREWIIRHCELSAVQVDALLAELKRRNAVHVAAAEEPAAAPREATPAKEPQAAPGFIGRLRRWLSDARSATPSKAPRAS